MTDLAAILAYPRGASFRRADLHIHSHGASHDVVDAEMTPKAIVAQAVAQDLEVISITDHNEITNVRLALDVARGLTLLVVPGVELSTPDGHLLCYTATVEALDRFYARLNFADRGTPNSRCQNNMLDCLRELNLVDGFALLAHVDAGGGFEHDNPGYSPHKADVVCHTTILGIELKGAESDISFAPGDPSPERIQIGRQRIERLGLGEKQFLARVLGSDAHTLAGVGCNAKGERRVSRIKMDTPTFTALRLALEDSDARVRLEDLIPQSIPFILGVQFEGGFLDGQGIQLSQNLNCIIGGRGTGKSTTFEAIRCLASEPSNSSLIDSDIWPAQLHLFWQDAAGQQHSLQRPLNGAVENIDDPLAGPTQFDIDCFGQGETAKISAEAQSNPLGLLTYLDRFMPVADSLSHERQACDDLPDLESQIVEAHRHVEQIPQLEKALAIARQQLKALEDGNGKDVIALERKIAEERTLRQHIQEQLKNLEQDANRALPDVSSQLRQLADPTNIELGQIQYQAILAAVDDFELLAADAAKHVRQQLATLKETTATHLTRWKTHENEALKTVEAKRKEFEAKGISLAMGFIQKLAKDEATHQKNLANLKKWTPYLADLKKKRAAALKTRWDARDKVGAIRDGYAKVASQVLDRELANPKVTLKFSRSAYSPAAAELIIREMGWRTVQVPRASVLVEQLTVPMLLAAIETYDPGPIAALVTPDGTRPFDKHDALLIIERLGQPSVKSALASCEIHDLPRLFVTKTIQDPSGKVRHIPREFAKLSLGQQQSVLLALTLCSNEDRPLIIDQPEDNLDGEFIYHTLVPVLRRAKERRQIIVVSHNANIAVLGDAELLVVLKTAANERATIVTRGSIDQTTTRDEACKILEGAKEAFQRRARIYGFKFSPA
jgi:DNA repair ATPase RecN